MQRSPAAADYVAVGVISAATLAFEIVLLRVFALTQWHHFASLAVSLALLGFGAAGTALSLAGKRVLARTDAVFEWALIGCGAGMLFVVAANYIISVRPLFAVWDWRELARLLVLDFAAFVPFFAAALAIGLVFMRWPDKAPKLYAANLFGSGLGCVLPLALLSTLSLERTLLIITALAFAAGCTFAILSPVRARVSGWIAGAATAACVAGAVLGLAKPIPVSDFHRLSYLLDFPDSKVLSREYSVHGMATVVESEAIRIAPGLSLNWMEAAPVQDALVIEAERVIGLPRAGAHGNEYLSATLTSAAFYLRPAGRVAVLGTGEAPSVNSVLALGARDVTWAEANPLIRRFVAQRMQEKAQRLKVKTRSPAVFLFEDRGSYDLVVFDEAGSVGDAIAEAPLLTRESIEAALARLSENGLLVIPMPLQDPPRYVEKTVRMVREALGNERDAGQHMVVMSALQDMLMLAGKSPISKEDVRAMRLFADEWGFDVLHPRAPNNVEAAHGTSADLAAQVVRGLTLGAAEAESTSYHDQSVPTHSQPYFWLSMRWDRLRQLWHDLGRQGLVYLDWSPLMLAVTLLVAAALAVMLILLPLGRLPVAAAPFSRATVVGYFLSLGLGYLILEMALLQRCILLLGEPVVAAAAVFTTFLVGSGAGSVWAPTSSQRRVFVRIILWILLGAGVAAIFFFTATQFLLQAPTAVRVVAIIAAMLPLAWALGRAMPWALTQLANQPGLVPWAWGINGFASVLAAPVATLISVHQGQHVTLLVGGAFYLGALICGLRWTNRGVNAATISV